jgi:hypothetical protein
MRISRQPAVQRALYANGAHRQRHQRKQGTQGRGAPQPRRVRDRLHA